MSDDQGQTEAPDNLAAAPIGAGEYKVKPGECIYSIAARTGHLWETIWDTSENADLKDARGDPGVLMPGDVLTIPELTQREVDCATEQRHRFRRLSVPVLLSLQLLEEDLESFEPAEPEDEEEEVDERRRPPRKDQPRANIPYLLYVGREIIEGSTDDDGLLEEEIPPAARKCRLVLEPGTDAEQTFDLQLGALSPPDSVEGVKERLAHLGFECGDRRAELTPGFAEALFGFQDKYGLTISGEPDQDTLDKLAEIHES